MSLIVLLLNKLEDRISIDNSVGWMSTIHYASTYLTSLLLLLLLLLGIFINS